MKNKDWKIGYCTNVHSGTDLESIVQNLRVYAVDVRERLDQSGPLPVGLWIPDDAARELAAGDQLAERFGEQLSEMELSPYTINGFPYGNFHQPVVKHRVYLPAWWETQRTEYTLRLCQILDQLLPAGEVGSISTLPLGWGEITTEQRDQSASNLRTVANFLRELEETTGRRIVIAIEPEPGCAISLTKDLVAFFDQYFGDSSTDRYARRYLAVCHDICHAAVMNESQGTVLRTLVDNGITIGKIQVSSAIEVRWNSMDNNDARGAIEQLAGFAEDRYLHQTVCVASDGQMTFHEDLPQLLATIGQSPRDRYWRIHFHVPIGLASFGHLHSTRDQVVECLAAMDQVPAESIVNHLEVETYAWSVLPESMRQTTLAESIAAEMKWLRNEMNTETTKE